MPATRTQRQLVSDFIFTGAAYVPPTTWWIGLFSVAPTPDLPGTEFSSDNGYARVEAPFAPYDGQYNSNSEPIRFPAALPDAWPDIVAVGFFDAQVDGDLRFYTEVDTTEVPANSVVEFETGTLLVEPF